MKLSRKEACKVLELPDGELLSSEMRQFAEHQFCVSEIFTLFGSVENS